MSTSYCLRWMLLSTLLVTTTLAASLRRSLLAPVADVDVPRHHYEELMAIRQIRNSHDATSDELEDDDQPTASTPAARAASGRLRVHKAPPNQVTVARNERVQLSCDVSGNPPPVVYWFKNGQPIRQAPQPTDTEETTNQILDQPLFPARGLALTKSKLVLDCADQDTEAIYTCVAESRIERVVSSTYVLLHGSAPYNESACRFKDSAPSPQLLPASIFMWSATYIEDEDQDAVLLCRAAGFPQPQVAWYDRYGQRIVTGRRHQILPTGDLKIRQLRWKDDMGAYTCRAENRFGSDTSLTFLYPTMRQM